MCFVVVGCCLLHIVDWLLVVVYCSVLVFGVWSLAFGVRCVL